PSCEAHRERARTGAPPGGGGGVRLLRLVRFRRSDVQLALPHPDPGAVRGRRRGRGRHDARDRRHLPHAGPRARATRSSGGTTRGDDMSAATHASTHVVEPAETPPTPACWGKLGMWISLS